MVVCLLLNFYQLRGDRIVRRIKVIVSLGFASAIIAVLSFEAIAYPPFMTKARKYGAKDCTFCHVEPEGGPPWNARGQWLVEENERRKAEVIDVDWLKEYKEKKGK
jgi:hypothetical protein